MPTKLPLLSALSCATSRSVIRTPYRPLAPFLYPCLQTQQREASILSSLSDNPSAYNKAIRRGRGPASGKGKTSGRGHKGQKQHGKVPAGFNGGQTPDEVVAGKRGFTNVFSVDMSPINLDRIQAWIDKGRLDPSQPITLKELNKSGCLHGVKDGVKLLARGKDELRTKINVVVSRASAEAIEAIEKLGGSVTTRYYSNFAIKKIMRNEMDPVHSIASRITFGSEDPKVIEQAADTSRRGYRFRLPDPISRKNLEYYRDPAKRGYLSYTVKEDEGPSLYFYKPGTHTTSQTPAQSSKTSDKAAENMW